MEHFEQKPGMGVVAETGITGDYVNECHAWFTSSPETFEEDLRFTLKTNGGKLFRRYEECYSPQRYANVVTEANKSRVARIDALVDEANVKAAAGTLTFEEVRRYAEDLYELIYGRRY